MDQDHLREKREKALRTVERTLISMAQSGCEDNHKRASLLSFWLCDYMRFLKMEETFDPQKNIKYNRGDIIKVHLGYNIGNEEGGLHYAVVIDNNNSKRNSTITIVPLKSMRDGRQIHHSSVPLGNEIYESIMSKHQILLESLTSEMLGARSELQVLNDRALAMKEKGDDINHDEFERVAESLNEIREKIEAFSASIEYLNSFKKEISKMKQGSIALVGQLTTISKIRIYDPVHSNNVLYGIKLTPTTLSLIDEKMKELYIYNK